MHTFNTHDHVIFFDDLSIVIEADDTAYVGRTGINRHVQMPAIGATIIEHLRAGQSVHDVNKTLQAQNVEIDLENFLHSLQELNFIAQVGSTHFPSEEQTDLDGFTIPWIRQTHVRWIFCWPMALLWMILIGAGLYAHCALTPGPLLPTYHEFFWHQSTLVVVLSVFIFDLASGAAHELFHFLAIRSANNHAGYFSISRRLLHLVFVTQIENTWALPKQQRILVYSAGMLFDFALMAVFALLTAYIGDPDHLLYRFSRFAILFLFFGFLFECRFYMKTDIYYIVSDLLKRPTLFADAQQYLRQLCSRTPQHTSLLTIGFAGLMIIASSIDIWVTLDYMLPASMKLTSAFWEALQSQQFLPILTEGLAFAFFAFEIVLVGYFVIRDYAPRILSYVQRSKLGKLEQT